MRALIAITIVGAFVTVGKMLPHWSLLPDLGFHPQIAFTLVLSL